MSEPIRVLHIITRMVRGGAQENTLANVARLNGGDWESVLATGPALGPEGSLEPECLAAGIRLIRIPDLVRELSPASDFRALAQIRAAIRKERPHLVHTHTSKAGILGRIAAEQCNVPAVVHTPHGHVFHSYESGLKSKLFVAAERWCAPKAHRLIALTENERREHLELGVGSEAQWRIVHSGIDFTPFEAARGEGAAVRTELGIPVDAPVIGTVGRLVPIKGQSYLIEAFAEVRKRCPEAHLLLVGDGELRQDLLQQADSLGLAVAQHDTPHTPTHRHTHTPIHLAGLRKDVPRFMAAMDIFALPSLNEGMGRVLVEAMAMNLPCVASRVSGIPDVVEEGRTGLLVEPRNAPRLAEALERLLGDPDAARAMGDRGRTRAIPGFGVARMIALLEDVYRETLQEQGIKAPPPRTLESATSA